MPRNRGKPARKSARRRTMLVLLACLAAGLALLLVGMRVNARTVHVRYATVRLEDLPEEFDGTRILYLSDVDLLTGADVRAAAALMRRLQTLRPDLLLLGGDYASATLFERLNSGSGLSDRALERLVNARSSWIGSLKSFTAPLGKFAVAGEADALPESLRLAMDSAGIGLLEDEFALLTRNDARLALVGLRDSGAEMRDLSAVSGRVSRGDCVLVLAHNPSAFVSVQTAEAADGGAWADLVLCGHTHGGQIVVAGRSALTLDEFEARYLSGWRREGGVAQLTSAGVGCTGVNLRLGSEAEVHLITLRRGSPDPGGFTPPNADSHWVP